MDLLWALGSKNEVGDRYGYGQRWQSIPSRSIWLEIGSRLIEPSKGLGSKYRASNRTEPAFVHHRAESNLQLKCSMLDQAARSGSVILSEEYDTLLSCWADRNRLAHGTVRCGAAQILRCGAGQGSEPHRTA